MFQRVFYFMFLGTPLLASTDECTVWFQKTKIEPGPSCMLKCVAAPVNMATFHCGSRCEEFCQVTLKEKWLFTLMELYPGLTNAEKKLASKEPLKTVKAYQLSWRAEELCSKEYFSSRTNDESDACRHFVWAALLVDSLGVEFGEHVLNAHEQDPKQPEAEKAMDLANNRLGLLTAERLKKSKSFNDSKIISSFREHLKNGDLIVIRPREVK